MPDVVLWFLLLLLCSLPIFVFAGPYSKSPTKDDVMMAFAAGSVFFFNLYLFTQHDPFRAPEEQFPIGLPVLPTTSRCFKRAVSVSAISSSPAWENTAPSTVRSGSK
jgi:hypothetical protein